MGVAEHVQYSGVCVVAVVADHVQYSGVCVVANKASKADCMLLLTASFKAEFMVAVVLTTSSKRDCVLLPCCRGPWRGAGSRRRRCAYRNTSGVTGADRPTPSACTSYLKR